MSSRIQSRRTGSPVKPKKSGNTPTGEYMIAKRAETEYGVDATVWSIEGFGLDRRKRELVVTLAGFASAEAAEAGRHPLLSGQVRVRHEGDLNDISGAKVRELILQTPEWAPQDDG